MTAASLVPQRLVLRRQPGERLLAIGHRGAAALAPENSLRALEAALALGVDLVELDVLARPDGTLVLAHSELAADLPRLDDALERLAAAPAGLLLDLKHPGIEVAVTKALRRYGLVERTLVCSVSRHALRLVAHEEPALARGLAYPDDRLGLSGRPRLAPLVDAGLLGLRQLLPLRVSRWLHATGARALSVHCALVTPALVARCHAADAAVLAWTVQDEDAVARLEAMGVDAMIADDPRILMERPPS